MGKLADALMRNLQGGQYVDPFAVQTQNRMNDYARALQHGTIQRPGTFSPTGGRLGIGDKEQALWDAVMGLSGGIAWHAGPHKFNKFDMSKMGSGEGAQAYGPGLYFAERKSIANDGYNLGRVMPLSKKVDEFGTSYNYRGKGLLEDSYEKILLDAAGGDIDHAIKSAQKDVMESVFGGWGDAAKAKGDAVRTLKQIRDSYKKANENKNLYKVFIPDNAISKMIDYDAPINLQAKNIQDAINGVAGPKTVSNWLRNRPFRESDPLYQNDTAEALAYATQRFGGVELPKILMNHGIPGIKYLDAVSRPQGWGPQNFVVFDETIPRILEHNGVPVGRPSYTALGFPR